MYIKKNKFNTIAVFHFSFLPKFYNTSSETEKGH